MTRAKQEDVVEETTPDTVKLYNANEGVHGRGPGIYLDREQAKAAEILRAQVEGREPDLDNPPPSISTPLVTAANLVQNYNNTLIAGDDSKEWEGEIKAPVFAEVPVEAVAAPKEEVPAETETSEPVFE